VDGADFLVVGGGVAGLSAAARLAAHGRVVVIEAEEALGYHSSGRSVTFSHYGIGNATVRGLTQHSRDFFLTPPEGDALPLSRQASALFFATDEMLDTLDALQADMARFTDALESADAARMKALFPPLKVGTDAAVKGVLDPTGLKLDADALLQHYARAVRAQGGTIHTGKRLAAIVRNGDGWTVTTEGGEAWSAPILIDAAGAWADQVAILAGVRPLGLQPKRRTIIAVEPPAGSDISDWPFLKTVTDDFYMMPEAGTLLASPVDEIDSDPCDAWPEEYDLAVTAAKVEHYTELSIRRIGHSWAGLRSFVADRVPTAGFAPDAPGFFWLAGQGGYGLQTAPAMAEIVETLVTGAEWPARLAQSGVTADKILPARLFAETN
jgi:D-arginine dehydrogenase